MAIGDQADFVGRLRSALPGRWFPDDAPVLSALLSGLASAWESIYALLTYTKAQTRISTATDVFLDGIGADFFGVDLQRRTAESDTQYRRRIKRELLRERGTRAAVISVLEDLTGRTPRVFEPARPADTGGYGAGGCGYGSAVALFDSRGSPGTYVGADGLVHTAGPYTPRYDYSSGPAALLNESGATNYCPYSNLQNGGTWGGCTVTQNAVVAPDGTMTAAQITAPTAGGATSAKYASPDIGTYTPSVWLRADAATTVSFYSMWNDSTGSQKVSRLDIALTPTWQRFRLPTITTQAGAQNVYWQTNLLAGTTIYAWGTQIEPGTSMSSLIYTNGGPATRDADVIWSPQSGGGWGSLDLPGQCFVEAYRPTSGGIANVGGYYSGTGWAGGGYGAGAIEYLSADMVGDRVTDDEINDAIARTMPSGFVAWARITS
ncbi:conserved protein of unknown function (plasmid) [Rhodovastum atsumiense]|uniref:Uncharacterized protein n=1 Tax=Rhodovastum atsumiense TaxID=504468 RepID=A0A5M6IN09_9PROT|nr:hypothetical protein [Rhodovastum atsumiense]KAA5609643.1 hypothetical protein F1189_23050 [Rhodovastum atsumiense]CAH2606509.1 conserved protein of unknown function [Rhodovastum atsumiense]